MAKFVYEAIDSSGKPERGELEAVERGDVFSYLTKKKLISLKIEEKAAVVQSVGRRFHLFGERVSPLEQLTLARNLSTALKSGLSISETIDILIADARRPTLRRILITARERLENGQTLAQVFEQYPRFFSPLFVGTIRAGESSGRLAEVLDELSNSLVRDRDLVKKVRSALIYPLILLLASLSVLAIFLFVLLPRLAKTFSSAHLALPWTTKGLIFLSNLVVSSWIFDLLVAAVIIAAFIVARRTVIGRRFLARIILRVPVINDLLTKMAMVRFSRTVGSLIASGVTIIEALRLSIAAVSNERYRVEIERTIEEVGKGASLAQSLAKAPLLFGPLLTSLVNVGERSGKLSDILKNFADFYDSEVENSLKNVVALIEPVLILLIGGFVILVAFSVLLPVYQMISQVGAIR